LPPGELNSYKYVTQIYHNRYPLFELVSEWEDKRQQLIVYITDIPSLSVQYKASDKHPYEKDPRIMIVDQVPRIRLSSACEAAANCLYSIAELSAQFGSKLTKGSFPASFNSLRKKIEKGDLQELAVRIGDLQWYRKIREIRTEWVHHSAIFIGEKENEPIMVIRSHRRISDQEEFKSEIQVSLPELINWIKAALSTVDAFGDFLLETYIVPSFRLDDELSFPEFDEGGFPIFLEDKRLKLEKITIREYLKRVGIEVY